MSRLINNLLYKLSPECRKIIRLKRLGRSTEFNILKSCVITPPPTPILDNWSELDLID